MFRLGFGLMLSVAVLSGMGAGCNGGCNPMAGLGMVEILMPVQGATIPEGEMIFFQGRAFFMGDVPTAVYEWRSSQLEEAFGNELGVLIDDLPLGPHTITFTAQGFDPATEVLIGGPVSASINITIVAASDSE